MDNKDATQLAIQRYTAVMWKFRALSVSAMVSVALGATLVFYAPPLVVAAVLQRFNGTLPTFNDLLPYLLVFAGVWLLGEVFWRTTFWLLQHFETKAMRHLYNEALRELSKKDIGFFHNNFAGSLTKRTLAYGRNFEGWFDTILFNVVANIAPLIFASFVLWQFSPWLVVFLLGMIGLTFVFVRPLIHKRKKLVDLREAASNKTAGHVADVIGNMDTVQAFARYDHEMTRHQENVDEFMSKTLDTWRYHNTNIELKLSPVFVFINTVGLALAVMFGSGNGAAMAQIFVVFSYYMTATKIIWEFNQIYRRLESAIAEATQFTELILTPNHITEVANPQPLTVTQGAVDFNHVDFSYRDAKRGRPLFKDFDLHIKPGEKIALVGHSGGGKTTVTKLLLRFNDITGGTLTIDGQNIATAKLADVRSAIAYVPQEPAMFHRSIRENIRYGRLDATDQEVEEAAKKANAHEFISKLRDGYDTLVGERGVKLSGGQRQRVAIARAIVKDAPILVLDEATSALDSQSEKLIQAALWELMSERTALVIAHRLSTIQKMDRIIVLQDGKIAEQGNHQELLAKEGGVYAELWKHQSGGFIEE
jgi:ATP-binding cassette, subfamily B, bacterial